MTYCQLTLDERYQIQTLWGLGFNRAEIARRLGRHPSTIAREITRNGKEGHYTAKRAAARAHHRQVRRGESCRKIRGELRHLIELKLRLSWSPEQISGRLRQESGLTISHETIYQHVLRDKSGLRYCLRFAGYKHHRFKKSKCAERTAMWRKLLEQRPQAANDRTEIGHWERDLVVGTQHDKACLLTIVDRRSRYTILRRVPDKTSETVSRATVEALEAHRELTKTLTNDNGVEFQRGKKLESQLGISIYYTAPSSPWQRGTVENTNGLIRQYYRKGKDIAPYPRWAERAVEETLNHRPRKVLDFRTPHEAHFGERLALMNPQSQLGLEFIPLI